MNSKLLVIAASSALLISSATDVLAAPYKTSSNQIVITGLTPKAKYPLQTTNYRNRRTARIITTNSCGEALISNGTGYQRLIINNQTIIPSVLPLQTHQRCNPRRNRSTSNREQVTIIYSQFK